MLPLLLPLHLKEKCSISKQNTGSQDWEEGNFKGVSSLTGSLFFWAAFISPTGWSASSPCTTSIFCASMLNHTITQHSGSQDWEEGNFKGVSSLTGSLFFWAAFISPIGWSASSRASSPCTTSISYASMLNHTIMQHSGLEDWEEGNFKGVSSLKGSSLSHELFHQPNWMKCILAV
jgi:hypothetical protein